jgi:hypothetical protein
MTVSGCDGRRWYVRHAYGGLDALMLGRYASVDEKRWVG